MKAMPAKMIHATIIIKKEDGKRILQSAQFQVGSDIKKQILIDAVSEHTRKPNPADHIHTCQNRHARTTTAKSH